jgi:hypothetical protein
MLARNLSRGHRQIKGNFLSISQGASERDTIYILEIALYLVFLKDIPDNDLGNCQFLTHLPKSCINFRYRSDKPHHVLFEIAKE